jgi:KDO2-lipid IV(A) lauroyltransferase
MKQVGFILFDAFSRFLALLPKRAMYLFADMLFFIGYYVIGYRKKVVFGNLENAFPGKSRKAIRGIAKKFYRHLSDVLIEDIAMLCMKPNRLKKFVRFKNLELVKELYQQKKNVMGILGHYGNWELLTTLTLHTPYTILSVYKPLKNNFFNQKVYEMRKRFEEVPIPMRQAYKSIAQYQYSGQPYMVGLVSDQSPHKNQPNYWTTFLNQDTAFFLGAEKIARKFNHTVIFPAVKKIKRGFYEIEFTKLFDESANTEETEITQKYVEAMENLIRENPEYWLWSHRRWKLKKSPAGSL